MHVTGRPVCAAHGLPNKCSTQVALQVQHTGCVTSAAHSLPNEYSSLGVKFMQHTDCQTSAAHRLPNTCGSLGAKFMQHTASGASCGPWPLCRISISTTSATRSHSWVSLATLATAWWGLELLPLKVFHSAQIACLSVISFLSLSILGSSVLNSTLTPIRFLFPYPHSDMNALLAEYGGRTHHTTPGPGMGMGIGVGMGMGIGESMGRHGHGHGHGPGPGPGPGHACMHVCFVF